MSDSEEIKRETPREKANVEPVIVRVEEQTVAPSAESASGGIPAELPAGDLPASSPLRLSSGMNDSDVERQMSRLSRRSFLRGGAAIAVGLVGWRWLIRQRTVDGAPWPFRVGLEIDEHISRDYYDKSRLAPTFSRTQARLPKENGTYGLSDDFNPSDWTLSVIGLAEGMAGATPDQGSIEHSPVINVSAAAFRQPTDKKGAGHKKPAAPKNGDASATDQGNSGYSQADGAASDSSGSGDSTDTPSPGLTLSLQDIKNLPRFEMVTELKCIEGWSVVVEWAGARFADLVSHYRKAAAGDPMPKYVAIETPDSGYYVGLDIESALHPQTLLCYEMNGKPLTLEHGAPLRLVIPVKYGIKNIKRIGTIRFTEERPRDYWAEQGYDWYAGH